MYIVYILTLAFLVICFIAVIHLYFKLFSLLKQYRIDKENSVNEIKSLLLFQNDLLSKILVNKKSLIDEKLQPDVSDVSTTKPVIVENKHEVKITSMAEIISHRRKS
jgi:hypothetical protein